LSETPDNIIVTIVRNKTATDGKIAAEILGRKNIFVIQGDLTNLDSFKVSSTKSLSPAAPLERGTLF